METTFLAPAEWLWNILNVSTWNVSLKVHFLSNYKFATNWHDLQYTHKYLITSNTSVAHIYNYIHVGTPFYKHTT